MTELARRVQRNLEEHRMVPETGHLLVAVSGGLDSMVLLALLREVAGPLGLRLSVAHAHHQLRGPDADADAGLVETVTRSWALPLVSRRLAVREALQRSRESLEMTARRLRHRFLVEAARDLGAGRIALAHHADDQVELILLRFLRGAGGEGLGGMAWRNASPADSSLTLVRPLLDLPKSELLRYAEVHRIPFREDASNLDRQMLRNRVRHELRPFLETHFNPSLADGLLRAAAVVGAEAEFVALEAERWLKSTTGRPEFGSLHRAVQRAVIRQQLWEAGIDGTFDQVERLRQSTQAIPVNSDSVVRRGDDGAVVRRAPARALEYRSQRMEVTPTTRPQQRSLSGTEVRLVLGPFPGLPVRPKRFTEQFDAMALKMPLTLRHWGPGDRFQPLGFPRPSKVQDLLVNRKIPAARRRGLVIGTDASGEVFWIEGLPPGERFKLTAGTTRVLTLKWRPRR